MKEEIRRGLCLALCLILAALLIPVTEVKAGDLDAGLYDQVDINDLYGRNALKTLPNGETLVYAYDQLLKGIETAEPSIKVYDGTNAISRDELYVVMDAFSRDIMGDFWFDGTYSMSYNNKTVINVKPVYNLNGDALKTAVSSFRSAAEEILAGVKSGMTDYEKSLYLHDKIAGIVEYTGSANAHNAYGALIDGKAVCEGYTEAYGYLLQRCDIQSFVARGTSENPVTHQPENHAWNFVRIDGHYHQTDVTWDDQQGELFHMYFNESDEVMLKDHTLESAVYPLPVCRDCDKFYFSGKVELLENYTVESVAMLLKNNGYKDHVFIPGDASNVSLFIQWFADNIRDIAKAMGVTGQFSFKYIQLCNELHLEVIVPGGPPAPAGVTISGLVRSPGEDESAVTVELCVNGEPVASVTVSGKNPGYVFENVQSGEYTLRVTRDGYITSELPVAVGTGSVEVEADIYRKGDVNGDGKVNNKDVMALMQSMAGWSVNIMNGTQDVNRDGKLNNKDAIMLMQFMAGWNVKVYE